MDDLEELHRLTVWYESFIKAYFELPAEIERRKQQQKQDQQAIRVFQQRLDQMAAEEERRQRAFESNFGRFLPDNLCPSIKVISFFFSSLI